MFAVDPPSPKPVKNFNGGVKCVSKWVLPEDTYRGGLDSLRKDYNAPFLLYGPCVIVLVRPPQPLHKPLHKPHMHTKPITQAAHAHEDH